MHHSPQQRQTKLKELIETYGEQAVFNSLGITRRTFDLYLKTNVTKMVPYFKLVRIENELKRSVK